MTEATAMDIVIMLIGLSSLVIVVINIAVWIAYKILIKAKK